MYEVIGLFKTNTPKQIVYRRGKKLNKLKTQENDDHHKLIRASNLWNNNYNEYESNDDRNKTYHQKNN